MISFIVDEANKSIHNNKGFIPGLHCISAVDKNQRLLLSNEDEFLDLLFYNDYNACPHCLKKYYLKQMPFSNK
jgi:hypothetical protein